MKINPLYCKYGNKKLCCKCNSHLINIYKEPAKSRKPFYNYWKLVVLKVMVNIGVQVVDKNYDGEYETLESFKKSGARDVTSEVLEEEVYESKYENPELMESLKKYLDEDESKDITDQNMLDILKIVKTLTTIMGISLLNVDELKIIKETRLLCQSNIKNKTEWSQSAKVKKKSR